MAHDDEHPQVLCIDGCMGWGGAALHQQHCDDPGYCEPDPQVRVSLAVLCSCYRPGRQQMDRSIPVPRSRVSPFMPGNPNLPRFGVSGLGLPSSGRQRDDPEGVGPRLLVLTQDHFHVITRVITCMDHLVREWLPHARGSEYPTREVAAPSRAR